METRKRTYNKPLLQSEAFVPNEYMAVCFYIACSLDYPYGGKKEDSDNDGLEGNHTSIGCRNSYKQVITTDNNGYIQIKELENDYFSGSDVILLDNPTDPANTEIKIHINSLQDGQTLYWKTEKKNSWECIHQGTVQLNNPAYKANHS